MVTTASFFIGAARSRSNVIDDANIDDLTDLALGATVSNASSDNAVTHQPLARPDNSNGVAAPVEPVVKKKRKLKRQRNDSDSEDEADKDAAALAERLAREEQRKRKAITETLEALSSFLAISKNLTKTAVNGISGGDIEVEKQIRDAIAHGSCTFIRTRADLSQFHIAPKFKKLKLYQQCGVQWLSLLHSVENANGILADEMGLGKTAQACVFLSYLYNLESSNNAGDFVSRIKMGTGGNRKSTLILVPSSVLDNWCTELSRWAPNLKNHIVKYHGAPSTRFKVACDVLNDVSKGSFVILISTITTVSSKEDIRVLRGLREFEYMLVDEAHALKNSETIAYRRLNVSFNIRHRLLLTGTPVQNRQSELGNLLQFAMPDNFDQSKIQSGINYLINNYNDAINEFPDLASLVEPSEIEDFKRGQLSRALQQTASKHSSQSDISDSMNQYSDNEIIVKKGSDSDLEETHDKYNKSPDRVPGSQQDDEASTCVESSDRSVINDTTSDDSSVDNSTNGNSDDTKAEYNNTCSVDSANNIDPSLRVFQRLIAPFILRRRKRTVMHELPEKRTFVVPCKMTGIQLELYMKEVESKVAQNRDVLVQKYKVTESDVRSMCNGSSKNYDLSHRDDFLVKSMIFRMRRICNHPLLVRGAYYKEELLKKLINYYWSKVEGYKGNPLDRVEKEIRSWSDFEIHRSLHSLLSMEPRLERFLIPKEEFMGSAKIRELFRIIEAVEQNKQKALVFSQFTMYLDLIEECIRLNFPHLCYLRLDGGHKPESRTDIVESFTNDDNITLLLISTKAGGVGLNLTVASTVILMDQDWNPHNDVQAEDRSHRIGQTQTVEVYKLLCEGSVEEYIMECCRRKLMLDDVFSGKTIADDESTISG
ncbi:SNF2 family protein [Babesia ovis]|uniref:SNF2 family protein n=1 Tax=Babesia ovis TaxID=5869 RepID=A0A9W5TA19_BABOV|nr:SNF2 family protein [Babesia ovis]